MAGLIELFQELGPRAAPGVQVIGELALMGGEGEKMRQRYRIFVHVSGRLGHGCGDAGGVLDWAGMVSELSSKIKFGGKARKITNDCSKRRRTGPSWARWARLPRTTSH